MTDSMQDVATAEAEAGTEAPAQTAEDRRMASGIAQQAAAFLAELDRDTPLALRFLRAVVKNDVGGLDKDSKKMFASTWEAVCENLASESFASGIEKDREAAVVHLRELIATEDIAAIAVLLRLLKPKKEKENREQSVEFANLEEFKMRNKPIFKLADEKKSDILRLEGLSERLIIAHAQDVADMLDDPEIVADVVDEARGISEKIQTCAQSGDQLKGGVYVSEWGMVAAGVAETAGQFKARVRSSRSALGVAAKKPKK